MARKRKKERRSYDVPPLFVRVTEKENDIIEAALRIKYGKAEGNKSRFVRQAVLAAAIRIIKQKKAESS